MVDHLTSDLLQ